MRFLPYLVVGIFLWDFTHQSGIHATIAGVLLALTIPHNIKVNKDSLLLKLEHTLSPYVAYGIMPLFAFANAGVSDSDIVRYVIEDGSNWEIGTGTYTASGTTLSRTVSESSNSGSVITLSGSAIVFVSAIAVDINIYDVDGGTAASVYDASLQALNGGAA